MQICTTSSCDCKVQEGAFFCNLHKIVIYAKSNKKLKRPFLVPRHYYTLGHWVIWKV